MRPLGTCTLDGCDRHGRIVRGMCPTHYHRWRAHGDPSVNLRPTMNMTPEDRLWSQIDRGGPDDCWPWTGGVNEWGYGRLSITKRPQQRMAYAHRMAYELLVGPVPDGLNLDHRCHTDDPTCAGGICEHRRCCNPAHMEPVTFVENIRRQHRPVA